MPSVTHDGRSFMVDGRRIWLASGRVPYARLPRESWAHRIQLAKSAGLNTIETPVFWNRHEVRAGRFDFTGENDLRHFIDLCGKAGLYVILGLGPYIGSEWDFGGLPAYLRESAGSPPLRTNNQQFLEACSRYISAVADQIRGWQITAPGTGGPIVLLQCETEWTCGHPGTTQGYLGELTRYIREAGLSVPLVNSNNLWTTVEGQIDGWAGSRDMLATMRQLTSVRPEQPRLVIDFATSSAMVWGREPEPVMTPRVLEQRLAEIIAGGGQFNVTSFCGGTNFGFSGGRTDQGMDTFACHSVDHGCLVKQDGSTGEHYKALRRIAHLASRFARVFASLDPAFQPVTIKPGATNADAGARGTSRAKDAVVSVVHASGQQGGVVFLFGPEDEKSPTLGATTLLLGDGTELEVPLGTRPVSWVLLDVNVSPRCHLDYCNLSALGAAGSVLVVHGPADSRAQLSVNGSPVEARVPRDSKPSVLEHEGLTIVLVRDEEADMVAITDDAVLVGVGGIDVGGLPIAPASSPKSYYRISAESGLRSVLFEHSRKSSSRAGKVELHDWLHVGLEDYADGTNARFASISAFQELAGLGCPSGYGWYRVRMENERASRVTIDFGPNAGDRLHVYMDGRFTTIAGVGPDAHDQINVSIKPGPQTMVVLADNLGRFSGGANFGERKGIAGDGWIVKPFRTSKMTHQVGNPVPVLGFRTPLWDVAEGDATIADRLTWTFKGKPKGTLLVRTGRPPSAGLMLINDKPFAFLDRSGPACVAVPEEPLSRGANSLQMTVLSPEQVKDELEAWGKSVTLWDAVEGLSGMGELAFARWEVPASGSFRPLRASEARPGVPRWYRCVFEAPSDRALYFEPVGLTKGQFYVNGRHCGRYFVATRTGKPVPPQSRYFIPASWLRAEGANELTVFDEHGASPGRVRLSH